MAEVAVTLDETYVSPMIQGMSGEDTTMTEGTVTYDIRFGAVALGSGERIRLIINIEAQNDFYLGVSADKTGNLLLQPDDFFPVWNRIYRVPL